MAIFSEFAKMFRGLPRAFWVLWVAMIVSRLSGFVAPFMAIYLVESGRSTVSGAGAMVSLSGAGAILAGLLGGYLADIVGRKQLVILSPCLAAACLALLCTDQSFLGLGATIFFLGLFSEMHKPSIAAAVIDLVPPSSRIQAFGLIYWGANIGFSIAALLGGYLAAGGLSRLFAVECVGLIVFALIAWLHLPNTSATARPKGRADLTHAFSNFNLLYFCFLMLGVCVVLCQSTSTLPLHLRIRQFSTESYGWLISINGFLNLTFQPVLNPILARLSPLMVLSFSALATGLGFGLNAVDGTFLLSVISIGIWSLGEIGITTISPVVVASLAPPTYQATFQGILQSTWGVAAVLAPLAGASIMEAFGSQVLWLCCLIMAGGIAMSFSRFRLAATKESR